MGQRPGRGGAVHAPGPGDSRGQTALTEPLVGVRVPTGQSQLQRLGGHTWEVEPWSPRCPLDAGCHLCQQEL